MSLETGWGKCDVCQELFPLAAVVPGFPAPGSRPSAPVHRPFNARALVERSAEVLLVRVPAEGMRAATWGIFGFAIVWLGFIAFWTTGALGVFGGQPPGAFNWTFASFSIPFWLAGFGMLSVVAWKVWGVRSIEIDREGMKTYWRCLRWSQSRWIEIDRVQHARHYDPQVKNEQMRSYAVEIVYRAASFVLPVDSEEEERWLIAEINDFMKSVAAR
jgi:hypothetical protein